MLLLCLQTSTAKIDGIVQHHTYHFVDDIVLSYTMTSVTVDDLHIFV